MICPECDTYNLDSARYCNFCDHPLPRQSTRRATVPPEALATVGRRLASWLIDAAVLFVLLMVVVVFDASVGLHARFLELFDLSVILLVLLYMPVYWAATGQTLGMALMHTYVVRTNGRPVSAWRALRRWLGWRLSGLAFGLGFLWALWDPDRQGWPDKLADTLVVRTEDRNVPVAARTWAPSRQRTFYTVVGTVIVGLLVIAADAWVHQDLDLQGGARMFLQVVPVRGHALDDATIQSTRQVIERRVTGESSAFAPVIRLVTRGHSHFILVDYPGRSATDVQREAPLLEQTGHLTLVALGRTALPFGASTKGYPVLARSSDIVSRDVSVGADAAGEPAINVTLRDPGATAVGTYTQTHVGSYMGIALDNRIYDSPLIQEPFSGRDFQITNLGSLDSANALAIMLRSQPLPVSLQVSRVRDVQPSLGPANVRLDILVALGALILVTLMVATVYRPRWVSPS